MNKTIEAKLKLGLELTKKEKAYYKLFMASNDDVNDRLGGKNGHIGNAERT